MSIPNSQNYCGGNFQDWLEVMLLPECNGKCAWCIDKKGYHPSKKALPSQIISAILKTGSKNVILLGGEPTLYPHLREIIEKLSKNNRNVYVTSNASHLSESYIKKVLPSLFGINYSIHHFDLQKNEEITGIQINTKELEKAIIILHKFGIQVRFNCNIIKNSIDSEVLINKYIDFAIKMNADSVRFAELKTETNEFISLGKILDYKYGLNEDPFFKGCNKTTNLGIPIFFRQMCGLQTNQRPKPINPIQKYPKTVIYYDALEYRGWQKNKTEMLKVILSHENIREYFR